MIRLDDRNEMFYQICGQILFDLFYLKGNDWVIIRII